MIKAVQTMSDTFSLGGDPGAIKASGQSWKSFASSASSASSDIKSVDSASFQGDEGDTYRGKVNDDLPPRLDKTHEAWEQVGSALITYASTLEDVQQRLATLKTQHDSAVSTANAKENGLENAKSADKTHDQQQTVATSKLKPGETLPPSTYQSGTSAAQSQLTEANNAVQDTINKANQVHSEHRTALNTCCGQIEDAKGKRFEKPPGFWGKLKDSVVDWVKDHADVLRKISGVLKIISAIAGVLSFIPVLNFVMGPIALATGGAALLIDVGLKLATGEGSWTQIGIDAALMVLPGAGKLVSKGLSKAAPNLVRALDRGGLKALNGLKNSRAGAAATKLANTRAGNLLVKGPGKMLNKVNSAVERGLSKVPGVSKYVEKASARAEGSYVNYRTRPVSKTRQTEMDNYKTRLHEEGNSRTSGGSTPAARYQNKFSDREYNLAENGGNGTKGSQFSDGLESRNASVTEAKLKFRDESPSQRNLDPDEAKPHYYDNQRAKASDQMQRYTDRVADPSNPMDKVVYHVAQPSQVDYYLDIAKDLGVGDKVVVVHSPW